jgi:hypothetical protein
MIVKGIVYNPNKLFFSQCKANIRVIDNEIKEYKYRIGKGWHNHEILDSDENIIVSSSIDAKSLWDKFVMKGSIIFSKDKEEILRYIDASTIQFPDGIQLDYDYRKYSFNWKENQIKFDEYQRQISFQCSKNFLFEIIVISIKSFWRPAWSDS